MGKYIARADELYHKHFKLQKDESALTKKFQTT